MYIAAKFDDSPRISSEDMAKTCTNNQNSESTAW